MARTNRIAALSLVAGSALFGSGCKDTVSALSEAVSPPAAASGPIVPGQIGGRWGTRWGGSQVCNLVLTQDGTQVTGQFTSTGSPPGTVTGTFENDVLTGTWSDQGGGGGKLVLTFAPDSRSFTGTWGSGDSATNGGSWTGNR
ncbi:MAG: hypothetical protein U0230_11990 [Polyangiales bacterium]